MSRRALRAGRVLLAGGLAAAAARAAYADQISGPPGGRRFSSA